MRSSNIRSENIEYTKDAMCKDFQAKLLKPQRLVSLSYDEEARRCQLSFQLLDYAMGVVAFADAERLDEVAVAPRIVIENRDKTVIVMSDQIPFFIKIRPGSQLYAAFETRKDLSPIHL